MLGSTKSAFVTGTDPEDTLRNAFAMFDAEHTGFIPEE